MSAAALAGAGNAAPAHLQMSVRALAGKQLRVQVPGPLHALLRNRRLHSKTEG